VGWGGWVESDHAPPSPPAPLPLGTNYKLVPNGRGELLKHRLSTIHPVVSRVNY
jgi:hypothetical protein